MVEGPQKCIATGQSTEVYIFLLSVTTMFLDFYLKKKKKQIQQIVRIVIVYRYLRKNWTYLKNDFVYRELELLWLPELL